MAENKKALATASANENGNAALTERLDDVAERVSEAQKATDAVAKEQQQRLAEQEQSTEQLQKEEEQRRARAAEAAKSVADRRAAVLDYTENYRENQKLEKAARATVSKAKQERLAAEAEAKAKAEREAEEALQREREELMARRARSSALLKKAENESETEKPQEKKPATRPVEKAMPKRASVPKPAPVKKAEAPAVPVPEKAPAEKAVDMIDVSNAAEKEDLFIAPQSTQDDTPDVLDAAPMLAQEDENVAIADVAVSAEAAEPSVQGVPEGDPAINNNEAIDAAALTPEEKVESDLKRMLDEMAARRAHETAIAKIVDEDIKRVLAEDAARAKALEEDMLKARLAGMFPEYMIPESLRMNKPEAPAKAAAPAAKDASAAPAAKKATYDAPETARPEGEPAIVTSDGEVEGTMQRLEDAVATAERSSEARLAAALRRIENMAARAEETAGRLEKGAPAEKEFEKKPAEAAEDQPKAAAENTEGAPKEATKPPYSKKELRQYLKEKQEEIADKQEDLDGVRKEPGETKDERMYRRLEHEAALLTAQLGAVANLAGRGHTKEAERFAKDAEKGVATYNKDVDKYNKQVEEKLPRLPEDLVGQIVVDRRLPDTLPFGLTTAELNSDRSNYPVVEDMARAGAFAHSENAPLNKVLVYKKSLDRGERKALRHQEMEEMQKNLAAWENSATKAAEEEALHAVATGAGRDSDRPKDVLAAYEKSLADKKGKQKSKSGKDEEPVDARGAASKAVLLTAKDDSFLKNEAKRAADYENRLAMIDAKRHEITETNKANMDLPRDVRDEIAAARQLELIQDEVGLLCLMNRYPNEKYSKKCMQACMEDIEEYNRTAERLNSYGKQNERLNTVLPALALAQGLDMAPEVWEQMDRVLQQGQRKSYTPTKAELKAAYARAYADEELRAAIAEDEKRHAFENEVSASSRKQSPVPEEEALGADARSAEEIKTVESDEKPSSIIVTELAEDETAVLAEAVTEEKPLSKREKYAEEELRAGVAKKENEIERERLLLNKDDISDTELRERALKNDEAGMSSGDLTKTERRFAKMLDDSAKSYAEIIEEYAEAEAERERIYAKPLASGESEIEAEARRAQKAAAITEKLDDLDKKATAEEERLHKLYAAKDAVSKAKALSAERKEEILTLSMLVAENNGNRKYAEKLSRMAESAAKQEAIVAKRALAKEKSAERKEAEHAMLAFAAAVSTEYEKSKGMPLSGSDKRKLNTAIHNAQRRYDRAKLAAANADEKLLTLTEDKAAALAIEDARRDATRAAGLVSEAENNLNTLRATKDAVEKSKALERREKTELLALAVAAADADDIKLHERLKKRVAVAVRKEEKDAQLAEKGLARDLDRWERYVAATEAEAQVAESAAQEAKERAALLANKKAEKEVLYKAYEQALYVESKSAAARAAADSAKAKRDNQKRNSKEHEDANAAMLALSGTLAESDRSEEKAKKRTPEKEIEKLDAAIKEAERRSEHAAKAAKKAQDRADALYAQNLDKAEAKAAKKEAERLKKEAKYEEDRLDELYCAKYAVSKSRVMTREEKEALIALVLAAEAAERDAQNAAAPAAESKQLKKQIAEFAKREAAEAKRLAQDAQRYSEGRLKAEAAADADASLCAQNASLAKAKVERLMQKEAERRAQKEAEEPAIGERLMQKRTDEEELHAAYREALAEEAKAERAARIAGGVKEKREAEQALRAEYKEANEAMLAFAVALAAAEKSKAAKEKSQRTAQQRTSSAVRETRRVDAAIEAANRHCEEAEAKCIATAEKKLALLDSKNAKKDELKAAHAAYLDAKAEAAHARSEKEMLEKAKLAAKKSKALTSEEKAELLSLASELSAEEKNARKAEQLKRKIEKAAEKEALAEKKLTEAVEAYESAAEIACLHQEAKAHAAEEAAKAAKEKAEELKKQNAEKKSFKKAYKAALLEQARAENAREAAAALKAKKTADAERAKEHGEAKAALAAFAAAFAVEQKNKNAKDEKALAAFLGKPGRVEPISKTITDAEKSYESALLKEEAARAKIRELEEARALKKERKAALLAVGRAEEEVIRAERRLKTLEAAKRATEKSKELSPEQKAEMLSLATAAGAVTKQEKEKRKLQKKAAAAVKKEALAEKCAAERSAQDVREWEKAMAEAEAKAIVYEERAKQAKANAENARIAKQSKKALERAYKENLISEYKAEQARKTVDVAKKKEHFADEARRAERIAERKEAEAAMLAFAAAMAAESKRAKREKNTRLKAEALAERKAAAAQRKAIIAEAKAIEKSEIELRCAREAELYARACEKKAMLSEQKALLIAPKKGKTREKLKAYESALYDRAEATDARSVSNALSGEGAAQLAVAPLSRKAEKAKAAPLSRKAEKLKVAAEKAARKQAKAEKRLAAEARYADKVARADEKQQRKYNAQIEKLQKRVEKADAAQEKALLRLNAQMEQAEGAEREAIQSVISEQTKKRGTTVVGEACTDKRSAAQQKKLQEKVDKAALAREKEQLKREFKRYKINAKVQKTDVKALRKAALAGQLSNAKLQRKLQYEQKQAEKQRIKDNKAWNALVKRDDKLQRHYSYMGLLELDRRDRARLLEKEQQAQRALAEDKAQRAQAKSLAKEQKAQIKKLSPTEAARLARGIFPRTLTAKERRARNRAYKKLDMQLMMARYDSVIAEAKRDLELALCDLSCTKANAKRIRLETAKRLRRLKKSRSRALQMERADNKRYLACLRAAKIKPKNHRVDRAELARLYQKLETLMAERDRLNAMLLSVYLYDSYKSAKQANTPWHKAFLREKKRWQKKLRKDIRVVDQMNLSRRDKQKLRADLDAIATAHADIVETKCRIKKQKLRGAAKRLQKQEIKQMRRDAIRAHKHMQRKMKIARAKEDKREFWYVSMLSLAITLSLICIGVLTWHWFGDRIWSFLNAHFPSIMSQLQ